MLTEERNPRTEQIDQASTLEILTLINQEDQRVAAAVREALPQIAESVEAIAERLASGGRLFYLGSGASGRLGFLDALDCAPTFGVRPDTVQAILAGGMRALSQSVDGAADDPMAAQEQLRSRNLNEMDAVVAISASGTTRYTISGARFSRLRGAFTASITCNPDSLLAQICDIAVEVIVGPETIAGSTRMKAGTAQKMVLNMISTACMIRLGHVYSNLMVNLNLSNRKLIDRGVRIVAEAAEVPLKQAREALNEAGDVRSAILMLQLECTADEARGLVSQSARVNELLKEQTEKNPGA